MPLPAAARFKIGDRVILGKHDIISGVGRSWSDPMDIYVGKEATIMSSYDSGVMAFSAAVQGTHLWKVDIDCGIHYWREVNMKPASGQSIATAIGHNTSVPINDFTCPTCQNNRCSTSEKTCWLCGNLLHI